MLGFAILILTARFQSFMLAVVSMVLFVLSRYGHSCVHCFSFYGLYCDLL